VVQSGNAAEPHLPAGLLRRAALGLRLLQRLPTASSQPARGEAGVEDGGWGVEGHHFSGGDEGRHDAERAAADRDRADPVVPHVAAAHNLRLAVGAGAVAVEPVIPPALPARLQAWENTLKMMKSDACPRSTTLRGDAVKASSGH
jgi:hypothetical protein